MLTIQIQLSDNCPILPSNQVAIQAFLQKHMELALTFHHTKSRIIKCKSSRVILPSSLFRDLNSLKHYIRRFLIWLPSFLTSSTCHHQPKLAIPNNLHCSEYTLLFQVSVFCPCYSMSMLLHVSSMLLHVLEMSSPFFGQVADCCAQIESQHKRCILYEALLKLQTPPLSSKISSSKQRAKPVFLWIPLTSQILICLVQSQHHMVRWSSHSSSSIL